MSCNSNNYNNIVNSSMLADIPDAEIGLDYRIS